MNVPRSKRLLESPKSLRSSEKKVMHEKHRFSVGFLALEVIHPLEVANQNFWTTPQNNFRSIHGERAPNQPSLRRHLKSRRLSKTHPIFLMFFSLK
jgi:hypothetical protein